MNPTSHRPLIRVTAGGREKTISIGRLVQPRNAHAFVFRRSMS